MSTPRYHMHVRIINTTITLFQQHYNPFLPFNIYPISKVKHKVSAEVKKLANISYCIVLGTKTNDLKCSTH